MRTTSAWLVLIPVLPVSAAAKEGAGPYAVAVDPEALLVGQGRRPDDEA